MRHIRKQIVKTETLWHVIVLSNLLRGYDKYARRYSKSQIIESTFPDRFFLLGVNEIQHGIDKAGKLLERLSLPGDRLLALKTVVETNTLHENTRTGIGRYIERNWITVTGVSWVNADGTLSPVSVEEAVAGSFAMPNTELIDFADLNPRSLSVLPIASGCQASCSFCFSEASASSEQVQAQIDLQRVSQYANFAKQRGAERFVITGGGEPGLVRQPKLCQLIETGARALGKTVLITNGHHLANMSPIERVEALVNYAGAGLTVLSISRHHHDDHISEQLMNLATDVASIANTWLAGQAKWPTLKMRLVCVLQKGGIDSMASMEDYVNWVTTIGVSEICFKELYLSTSIESVYHQHATNMWSHAHQIPLSIVLEFCNKHGFSETAQLPWGAPIFSGEWNGRPMKIAAYTEPSLLWERSEGVARSWNLMSDGRCLVSLEDRQSEIVFEESTSHDL